MLRFPTLIALGLAGFWVLVASAADEADPYAGKIAPASEEGLKALKRIQVPAGLAVELVAAEPHLANPIAFCIDEKGHFFVAETFRLHHGVTDNRQHGNWLEDDLASRTVADRLAMYKKYLGQQFASYGKEHDRLRRIEVDADGKPVRATVFADGFSNHVGGLGSGVLARQGKIWFSCIPDLWLLRDTKGTGRADVKQALHTGYGVHVAFLGHDLHGLCFGPDGKLYFSVGDRGLHVQTGGRTLSNPDSGAVLRCHPDGSELEIVATGLRNPQELAFDQHGNLFTGDNNADGGDAARWVYVVEGGDSGWRLGYQYLQKPQSLGPWNAEKLWHLPYPDQAAYLVPPIAHLSSGPSGLAFYSGVGLLPERYQDHFFLCDFRGSAGNSGIHAFALKPHGASFQMVDAHRFAWSILATDCDFGPDGACYLSDWVDGWRLPNKGRIYKIFDPNLVKKPAVLEVKKLLAEGMTQRSPTELCRLLQHKDRRLRQEAQFALADRNAVSALEKMLHSDNYLTRLHAIWGLGQIGRKNPGVLAALMPLLTAANVEVRAQAVKVLGEGRYVAAQDKLLPLLKDVEPRVRFFAALSLGKMSQRQKPTADTVEAVFELLRSNADADPYLRHAGVMVLTWLEDRKTLERAAGDSSSSVRLAALLAMRRLHMPQIARFLADPEPRLVLEAARAINDVPIADAMPQLAALIERPLPLAGKPEAGILEPLLYRILNAQNHLGKKENATALATFAAQGGHAESLRLQALRYLGEWSQPAKLDRIVGLYRPLAARSQEEAVEALRPALAGIMTASDKIRVEGVRVAARLGIKEISPALRELVLDQKRPASVRLETLKALEALQDAELMKLAQLALRDEDPRLRHQGRRIVLAREKPELAVAQLAEVLERGTILERQGAVILLAELKYPAADAILLRWLEGIENGQAAAEIHLDLLEAARQRNIPKLQKKLAQIEAARPKNDPLTAFRPALVGGDADAGRKIFLERAEVQCVRCHKLNNRGGDVGPDLTGIGRRQKREYLLEALVAPNQQIAKGYETLVLTLTNGQTRVGILKWEDAQEVRLMTVEGQVISVPRAQVEERTRGKSAMPEDLLRFLSPRDVRDLVEFLASLQ